MSSELPVIEAHALRKVYTLFASPVDRLRQLLWGTARQSGRSFTALGGVTFSLRRGEVLGLVGRNGAGKSTLLQMVCGTLQPTDGRLQVRGRVAALLELGAGFNPEFSGRENVYLYAAVLGLSRQEIDNRFDEIVAFSGIGNFIDQPVKTYSSGMYVRLAFSIATSVEPDILVVDEALSVGDGEFARKSFDRIMQLRASGTTILFCSHSLFQIESICSRAMWLHDGKVVAEGHPAQVVSAYQEFLDGAESAQPGQTVAPAAQPVAPQGHARLVQVRVGGLSPGMGPLLLASLQDDLRVQVSFTSDPALPCPSLAVTLHTPDGRIVSSAGAWNDGVTLQRNALGRGTVVVCFPSLPLLKGRYYVSVHLFCERGLHIYDVADRVMPVLVSQNGIEQGLVHLPRTWQSCSDTAEGERQRAPETASAPESASTTALLDWMASHVAREPVGAVLALPDTKVQGVAAMASRFGLTQQADGLWQKTRAPRWSLVWVRSHEASAEWFSLFEACFGQAMPQTLWQWKYGHHEVAGTAVLCEGRMVGFYGCMPRQVLMHGQTVMALQIGDVMVHPSQRGVLTRQGPFFLSCATLLEQLMGYGKPFLLGFGFPNRKALEVARHLKLYDAVDQMVEVSWPAVKTAPDWRTQARPVAVRDMDEANACWSAMAHAMRSSVLGVRDWAFISQRYLNHPVVGYTVLMVRQRLTGKALGLVVLRDHDEKGVELMDMVAAPVHFGALARAAVRFAYLSGRPRVFGWVTRSHKHLLAVHGAAFEEMDVWIPANVWTEGPSVQDLQKQWWLMSGDSDFR